MDMVLKVCVNDGSEIIIDGFDKISFSDDANHFEVEFTGYTIQKDYPNILNNLTEKKFIKLTRHDEKDELIYKEHSFAFKNSITTKNQPLIFPTNSITTIIDMYN